MELSVVDRMVILSVLPKEGEFATLRILRDLTSALSFSEKELEDLQLNSVDGRTQWKEDAAKALENVEIEVGPKAFVMIEDAFRELSKQKKLTLELLPTFEKFVKD